MNKEERLMMSEEEVRQRAKELLNLPKEHLITQYMFLEQENKQLKEKIDKAIEYMHNFDVFDKFSFPLMKKWEEQEVKSSIEYEFNNSLYKDLLEILKGDIDE